LQEFTVTLPDQAELERLAERLTAEGIAFTRDGQALVVRDPWQNQVRLVVG
jgi:DNA-binding transcriptional MocR family regulator